MARQVRGWDPVRAWCFIRASRAYRDAWERNRLQPGLPERASPGPGSGFPVRMRADADAGAMRWGMLAWEDPYTERPLAPFWAEAGVIDGKAAHDMPPLARLAAEGGAYLDGLRLDDGRLMLRIERDGRSVPVRLDGRGAFPADAGLLLLEREVSVIEDVWSGAPAPRPGRARGTAGTVSFCWRWRRRRRGSPSATMRSASGSRAGSRRSIIPTAGWKSASSANTPGQGRS